MPNGSGISHRHSSHIDTIAGIHSRTLIPGPTTAVFANRARDQSGAVPSISTIATYPVSFIALIPDLETFGEFEILPEG